MRKRFGILSLVFAGLVSAEISCQEKEPESEKNPGSGPDPAAKIAPEERAEAGVVRVHESRTRSEDKDEISGDVMVTLRFEPPVEDAELVRVELATAVDSLGNDLINPDRKIKEAKGRFQTTPSGRYEIWVALEVSAREAKAIAELSGTVVFQDPSMAAEPITLSDFRKTPGEYLENDQLEKAGLSVAFLDEATYDEKGSKLIAGKMLGKLGQGDDQADEKKALMVAAPMKMLFTVNESLLFVVDDPEERIIKVEGLDDEDENAATGTESLDGLWVIPGNSEKGISKVRLHLRSEGAEVSRKFSLEEILLP